MKTMRHTLLCAAVGAVALALASCEHKDLCYDHPHSVSLNVAFDWQLAPEASPASMDVYFFPAGGGTPQRFAFDGRDGGEVVLTAGTYDVLCLNSDTETLLYRNTERWNTFEVYTRNASVLEGMGVRGDASEPPRAEGAEHESGALEPDMLWTASLTAVEVKDVPGGQTVTLCPEQSVTQFTFRITGADNLDHVSALSGTLSGLGRGFFPGPATVDAECVTVPFAVQNQDNATVGGAFRGFGHCPNGNDGTPHMFVVYAVLEDGSQWYYTYDVTAQVHNAPDQRHIHIELDGLPLPTPITNGSGMQPDVDDWHDVIVDIPM